MSDIEGIRNTIQCVCRIGQPICRIREERPLQAPCLALNHQASNTQFGFQYMHKASTSVCWEIQKAEDGIRIKNLLKYLQVE